MSRDAWRRSRAKLRQQDAKRALAPIPPSADPDEIHFATDIDFPGIWFASMPSCPGVTVPIHSKHEPQEPIRQAIRAEYEKDRKR